MKLDSAGQNGQAFETCDPSGTASDDARVQPASTLWRAVEAAAAVVRTRYPDGVNARQVARLIGVDRSRLAAAFRQQTGLTLHEYIVRIRLQAAVTMIAAGTKIEATALLVGYRDKSSFYRQFRRRTGVTPAAFRSGQTSKQSLPPGRLLPEALAVVLPQPSARSGALQMPSASRRIA